MMRRALGPLVVATANVRDGLSRRDAFLALRLVAEGSPDLIALQEWSILRRRLLRRAAPDYAWHAPVVGGCPVGVRRDRLEIVERRTRVLSRPGWALRAPHQWRPEPGRVAGVAVCRERASGCSIAMVSFHLVSGVESGGAYRPDRRRLVSRHQLEATRLGRLVAELTEEGHLRVRRR